MARTITISDFLGLNNVLAPEDLHIKENFKSVGQYLKRAKNIDIDDSNKPRRRLGYQQSLAGTNCHSLWSNGQICLYREGSYLKRLNDTLQGSVTLRSGITGNLTMAYLPLDNKVYYSDGNISGVIENGVSRSWGLSIPPTSPVLLTIAGGLLSGTYQVAYTYVRNDGQESGATEAAALTVAANQGVRITGIIPSADPTVTKIHVYVTRRDSETFYRAYILNNAANQVCDHTTEDSLSGTPLRSQFLSPPPAGQILEYYNGRIFIGSFDAVWYTEPFKYELCDLSNNFIQFESDVTLIGAVSDGVYFGTDNEISFVRGDQPKSFKWDQKADYGAIFGTPQKIIRPDVGQNEATQTLIIFASAKGICIGGKSGEMINKSRETFIYEPAYSGVGFVRKVRGIDQYLCTLTGNDKDRQELNLGYGDSDLNIPVQTVDAGDN